MRRAQPEVLPEVVPKLPKQETAYVTTVTLPSRPSTGCAGVACTIFRALHGQYPSRIDCVRYVDGWVPRALAGRPPERGGQEPQASRPKRGIMIRKRSNILPLWMQHRCFDHLVRIGCAQVVEVLVKGWPLEVWRADPPKQARRLFNSHFLRGLIQLYYVSWV